MLEGRRVERERRDKGRGQEIGKGRGGEGEFKNIRVEGSAKRDDKEGNEGERRTEERERR